MPFPIQFGRGRYDARCRQLVALVRDRLASRLAGPAAQ